MLTRTCSRLNFLNNQEDHPLKLKSTSLLIAGALFGAAVMPAHASNDAMMDLLKVLHQRGTITDADYDLLANAAKADKEAGDAVAMKVDKVETKVETKTASLKALEWAERVKIKGDVRFRHEVINNSDSDAGDNESANRLRIRARLGAYAQINDTTKAGIRLVSTTGDATSTNATLDDNFESKTVGWDLAYIDWAPTALGGDTNFVFGKMKKPWMQVNDVIWDGDTNPEGVAVKTKFDFDGFSIIPSVGYYILDDNGNNSFTEDSHVGHAQLASVIGEKTKVGVSYYGFENSNIVSMEERMFEIFGETAIPGTPVTAYASYVKNTNANASGDDDNAWSLGAKAKFGSFKAGYEYRDLGVNAINPNFGNSDFVSDSDGHILKAAYEIDKNLSFGGTYFITQDNRDNNDGSRDRDRIQVDMKVKF